MSSEERERIGWALMSTILAASCCAGQRENVIGTPNRLGPALWPSTT